MLPLMLGLALAAAGEASLVTIESDLAGTLARVDGITQELALPVTLKLAPGTHEISLEHASLPPIKATITVSPGVAQRFSLSIEDPEHLPFVRLLNPSADDDVAIDGRLMMTPIPEMHSVATGTHEVVLKKRGGAERRLPLVLARGQTAVIDLGGARPDRKDSVQLVAPIQPSAPVKKSSALSTAGWIAIGAGAASAVLGTVFAVETLGDLDREETARTSPMATRESVEPHQDAAKRHALAANLTIGTAVLSIGAGIVMLLLD
jgi:hypothetical protein